MFMTAQEFCDLLSISKQHLSVMLKKYGEPVYKTKRLGRTVYLREDALNFVELIKSERLRNKQRKGNRR